MCFLHFGCFGSTFQAQFTWGEWSETRCWTTDGQIIVSKTAVPSFFNFHRDLVLVEESVLQCCLTRSLVRIVIITWYSQQICDFRRCHCNVSRKSHTHNSKVIIILLAIRQFFFQCVLMWELDILLFLNWILDIDDIDDDDDDDDDDYDKPLYPSITCKSLSTNEDWTLIVTGHTKLHSPLIQLCLAFWIDF